MDCSSNKKQPVEIISKNIKLQYFILFIVAFFAYSNTLNHSYAWDDALVIQQNKYTKAGLNGLKDIWTKKLFLHERNVYRPIPQSIYAITYQIAPNNPKAAHIVNVLIYGLAIMATFLFLTHLFSKQNKWLLFFITLLFSLHPVHTEVVANIKSLDEILAYLFGILSLTFWLKFLKDINLKFIIITIIFFVIALLSKISAITFLAIFPLITWFHFDLFKIVVNNTFAYFKKLTTELTISNKALSTITALALFLIFVLFKKQQPFFLIIPILVFITYLLFKTSNNLFRFSLYVILIIILTGFNFQISIITLAILFSHYLLVNNKSSKLFITIGLAFFALCFYLIKLNISSSIFILPLCFLPFVFNLKKDKIALITLGIITVITFVIKPEIKTITIVLLVLFIYFALYKKINFKVLFLVLITTTLVLDGFLFIKNSTFQKLNTSNQIIPIENNQAASIGMTILHNTLWQENNPEIKYATIAKIQLKYLQLLFYPNPLVHQYGVNQITKTNFKDWQVWFSIIIHLALFLFALYKLKDKSPIAFGILFYLVTISIYTNIVILMPDTLAERFLFSPSLGFLIALVFAVNELLKLAKVKNINLVISLLFIPILLTFTYQTTERNKAWKNNFTLAKNTIKHAPNNAAINAQYATELYLRNGDSTLIIKHYKRAIEIYPEFYSATKDLANYYVKLKQSLNAEKLFIKCIDFNETDWDSYYYLAFINYEKKNYPQAISFFHTILLDGDKKVGKEKYLYASEFLARCYFNMNQIDLADKLLKDNYQQYKTKSSLVLLGNIYHQSGNTQKSLETYSILLIDFPNDQDLLKTIEILKNSLN